MSLLTNWCQVYLLTVSLTVKLKTMANNFVGSNIIWLVSFSKLSSKKIIRGSLITKCNPLPPCTQQRCYMLRFVYFRLDIRRLRVILLFVVVMATLQHLMNLQLPSFVPLALMMDKFEVSWTSLRMKHPITNVVHEQIRGSCSNGFISDGWNRGFADIIRDCILINEF